MSVYNKDTLESVVDNAPGNVEHILYEGRPVDGDGAWEVHVVRAISVMLWRQKDIFP